MRSSASPAFAGSSRTASRSKIIGDGRLAIMSVDPAARAGLIPPRSSSAPVRYMLRHSALSAW